MAEKKEYKCENCGKLFQNPQALKMHERWNTCQTQTPEPKQPEEATPFEREELSKGGDVVEPSSSEGEGDDTFEDLSLDDLGFNSSPEPVAEGLTCSECGYANLTGNETQCPSCSEVFE